MALYKLLSEEYENTDYHLIAIHTPIEDYRLAFYINKNLPIKLSKSKFDIGIRNNKEETHFSRFIYEDEESEIFWNLIQNKNEISLSTVTPNFGLFENTKTKFATKSYLIPEFKKVDFFLKIEDSNFSQNKDYLLSELKKIDKITTVYSVEIDKIKSKNNLIF